MSWFNSDAKFKGLVDEKSITSFQKVTGASTTWVRQVMVQMVQLKYIK